MTVTTTDLNVAVLLLLSVAVFQVSAEQLSESNFNLDPNVPINKFENGLKDIPVSVTFPKGSYHWAFSIMDSSRISTFVIAILLIVYGSFRSLNMDEENAASEANCKSESNNGGESSSATFQTINTSQAICLPIGASLSLLFMFFFFDSMQIVFTICTAVLAASAFAFLLLPLCQYIMKPCSTNNKFSIGCCGRFTPAELLSLCLSTLFVSVWVCTGHWLLMDALSMGLCVSMIALLRLPSLKVSCLLLSGLLVYDVFWVFFSSYLFNANVMVQVATAQADNPVGMLARKINVATGKNAPQLSLPGKLVFPSFDSKDRSGTERFSMLGLGDIVMPGLLLCFVLRYDNYKKRKLEAGATTESTAPPGKLIYRVRYFHCTLIGYFVGLVTATVASEVNRNAQPALLYLVPFTLLPLITMAYIKGDLKQMWNTPFNSSVTHRFIDV